MAYLLSRPAEALLDPARAGEIDTLIVGSGYGAAMAALRLSEPDSGMAPEGIVVLERGREYQPGEFPKTIAELPGHLTGAGTEVRFGDRDALFDLKIGNGVSALVGSGLGGTSLINGGVAIDPGDAALARWPRHHDGRPWRAALADSAHTVKRMLGVNNASGSTNHHPRPHTLGKVCALAGIADGLETAAERRGEDIESVRGPEPVPLAITFEEGPNAVGIRQNGCVDCGNCITGCNIGAKNTLAMNVWPLAAGRGVRLYTGGTVQRLRRAGAGGWEVDVVLTRNAGDLDCAAAPETRFTLSARRVILAAGTFGSTEILQRSRDQLQLSRQLGKRFSVNGDMMALGLRRRERVDAAAHAPSTAGDHEQGRVGPLTAAQIRVRARSGTGEPHEISIQDGAVPYPMRRIFGELLTTEHLARSFVDGRKPANLAAGADPLTVDEALLDHSQLVTVMGPERGSGSLELRTLRHRPGVPGEQVLTPSWHGDEGIDEDYFADVESLLEASEAHEGFDGGQLLPCPPWRILPKGLEVLEGLGGVGRHRVTTHPLGGCCMATDAADGVVDTRGRVFAGSRGDAVHDGLYVLDGAIIPGPVGVNPFMTIALLAHHLADGIAAAPAPSEPDWQAGRDHIPDGVGYPVADPQDTAVAGVLRERLYLDQPEVNVPATSNAHTLRQRLRIPDGERLVLDVEARCDDLFAWLERPSRPLPAAFRFARGPARGDTVADRELVYLGDEPLDGTVVLGGYEPSNLPVRLWRSVRAIAHFFRMRGDEIRQRLQNVLRGDLSGSGTFLRVTLKQAWVQSNWRHLSYRCQGRVQADGPRYVHFTGRKTLAYAGGHLDPLNTLRRLHFTLDGKLPHPRETAHFKVDMIRMTRDLAAFRVDRSPDSPTTLLALASAGLFFLRSIIQTHFWSFGAPGYGQYDSQAIENRARRTPPPERLDYRVNGKSFAAGCEHVANPPRRGMRLLRYTPTHAEATCVPALLIHGLGHGSRVFWTDTTPVSLTQHLLGEGFEVWLLDHRLSCNLGEDPRSDLSMEDIAEVDIPWAVRTVFQHINQNRSGEPMGVKVFAHCIGAGAFAMSALGGHLQRDDGSGESMIDSAVIHAVTPWLVASEDNRWRANAISMFRSYFDDLAYDPIPHRDPKVAETLADRFASSFGWPEREFDLHSDQSRETRPQFSRTICNRMTLFYGDEWVHSNLDHRTHLNLHTLVGPAPIEVLRQAYYCIVKGRLTNREGTNEYVRQPAFLAHWRFPTLFLHGSHNKVFDADSSRASAAKLRDLLGPAGPDVSVRIVKGYGHMDVLFGKAAHRVVFPSISGYLATRTLPPLDPARLAKDTPPAHVIPPLGPATGPILSRPRVEDGRRVVTMWSELSQFTAYPATVEYHDGQRALQYRRGPAGPSVTSPAKANGTGAGHALPNADVRLDHLDVSNLAGPVSVSLRYHGSSTPPPPRTVGSLEWTELPWFRRAFDASPRDAVSFLAGSCLYPGVPGEAERSDRIFAAMQPFVTGSSGTGVDHLLLLGDQIYADATVDLFDPGAPLERFRDRYRRAFGGPERHVGSQAHWVMSHLPTYFAVDDHEISDNWPRDRLRRRNPAGERYEPEEEFAFARREAQSFMVHEATDGNRLWYAFRSAGWDFFVFDTRTERTLGPRDDVGTLLGREQRAGFERWLETLRERGVNRPLIATGSPLGPITEAHQRFPELCDRSDTLLGFPGFLCWLYDVLCRHGMTEVVCLSGDTHLSCLGDYAFRLDDGPAITIRHVVASGLFAPLPFANPPASAFEGKRSLRRVIPGEHGARTLILEGQQHVLCSDEPHFLHVRIDASSLAVSGHTAAGGTTYQDSLVDRLMAPARSSCDDAVSSGRRAADD